MFVHLYIKRSLINVYGITDFEVDGVKNKWIHIFVGHVSPTRASTFMKLYPPKREICERETYVKDEHHYNA